VGSIFKSGLSNAVSSGSDSSVVVVDIGSSTLKILHGELDGKKVIVKNFSSALSPAGMVGLSYYEDASKIADPLSLRLDVLIESFSAASNRFIVSLPDNFSVIKYISLENTPPSKLIDAEVRKQIEGELPYQYDSWNVVSQIIDRGEQGMNIIALATFKKNFEFVSRCLSERVAEPDYVSISSFLAHEMLYPYLESKQNENIAVINMGNATTCVSIFKGSNLRIIQNIFVGGHHFSSDVAGARQISLSEAEAFKRNELFFLPEYAPQQEKVKNFGMIKNTFMELVRGIFFMFENYFTKYFEEKINEIIIFGGGANFKNIDIVISGLLNTPVKKASTIVKAYSESTGKEIDDETVDLCLPMLGSLFGGASDES